MTSANGLLLEAQGIKKKYGGVVAIEEVDLDIAHCETLGLIGPNGSGKTTLVNVISGFVPPTAGVQRLHGVEVPFLPAHRTVRKYKFARTFQNIRLGRSLSAENNVLVGMHDRYNPMMLLPFVGGAFERKSRERARELLDVMGIAHLAKRTAGELSYGDQRRVEIARALASDPVLLMLDEPAAGMNPAETEGLVGILQTLRGTITMLLIEHNMSFVSQLTDRVAVLDAGKRIALATPAEILADPLVKEAYLGKAHAND